MAASQFWTSFQSSALRFGLLMTFLDTQLMGLFRGLFAGAMSGLIIGLLWALASLGADRLSSKS